MSEQESEKDAPLRYDIRLLGRILGDTIRAQEGEGVFETIETIRQTGLRFHRDADEAAGEELRVITKNLPSDQAVRIIRAFGHFSHLANIAEDQHHIRRTRAHAKAGAADREGSMAYALKRAKENGVSRSELDAFFKAALVSPVLTAHPTEIRRRSSIDREMEIARLLDDRDRINFTPEELEANRDALRRAVLTLWQTSLLRGTRLRVIDEVINGLAYYDHTFLRELPRIYASLEDHFAAIDKDWEGLTTPSFLRIGSWIGGDRDGNPHVTADVLREALRMQSERALAFYLDEAHTLGGELSLDDRIVPASEDLDRLAESSPDVSVHRRHEPYRRAITGIYARLAASAWTLNKVEALRHAVGEAPAYASAAELRADLDVLDASLVRNGSENVARGRLRNLRRAVDVFGFHLAAIDLRQNSDVHERVIAELYEAAGGTGAYRALAEEERIELLGAEIANARPLASITLSYSDETVSELSVLRAAVEDAAVTVRRRCSIM